MTGRILKGDKVRLRPLARKDIPFVINCHSDPRTLKRIANTDFLDLETKKAVTKKERNHIKNKPKDDKLFIIEAKVGGSWQLIGDCELARVNKRDQNAIFLIALIPSCWRKGYGTEAANLLLDYAFFKIGLHRIESHVMEYNAQSIAFHMSIGFARESRQKEAKFVNRKFYDRIIFRLLESEWKNLSKSR